MNTERSFPTSLLMMVALCLLLGACSEDDNPAAPTPAPADLEGFFAAGRSGG